MSKKSNFDDARTESVEFPGLTGSTNFRLDQYEVGIAHFSRLTWGPDRKTTEATFGVASGGAVLNYQTFNELRTDHGEGAFYTIVVDAERRGKLPSSEYDLMNALRTDHDDKAIARLNAVLERHAFEGKNDFDRKVILQAFWADAYVTPMSDLWLAVMAHHAYVVTQDDFTFGYLTALLDLRKNGEVDFLRGRKTVQSASLGGRQSRVPTPMSDKQSFPECRKALPTDIRSHARRN